MDSVCIIFILKDFPYSQLCITWISIVELIVKCLSASVILLSLVTSDKTESLYVPAEQQSCLVADPCRDVIKVLLVLYVPHCVYALPLLLYDS